MTDKPRPARKWTCNLCGQSGIDPNPATALVTHYNQTHATPPPF